MARVAAEDLQMLALLMLIPPVLQADSPSAHCPHIFKVPAQFCRELPCAMKLLTSSQMSLFLPDFHQRCTSNLICHKHDVYDTLGVSRHCISG